MASFPLSAQNPQSPVSESHGTINILFANQNGLVALTDSMLSYTGNPPPPPSPNHQKLFKIDDKTVCMMAGSYSNTDIVRGIADFDLWVPNIMHGFATQQQKLLSAGTPLPFAMKLVRLKETFEQQLSSNLQAFVLAHPEADISKVEPIELTLAGYDIDGVLKVEEITLTPEQTASGIRLKTGGLPHNPQAPTPLCELRSGFDANPLYDIYGLPKPRVVGVCCSVKRQAF